MGRGDGWEVSGALKLARSRCQKQLSMWEQSSKQASKHKEVKWLLQRRSQNTSSICLSTTPSFPNRTSLARVIKHGVAVAFANTRRTPPTEVGPVYPEEIPESP